MCCNPRRAPPGKVHAKVDADHSVPHLGLLPAACLQLLPTSAHLGLLPAACLQLLPTSAVPTLATSLELPALPGQCLLQFMAAPLPGALRY